MLKVVYIAHYSELYGANRSLLDLVIEARKSGAVDPFMYIPREGPIEDRLKDQAIPYKIGGYETWMSERHYMGRLHHRFMQHRRYERGARKRWRKNLQVVGSMSEQCRSWGVDLIHANSSVAAIASLLKERSGLPLVWHIRELPEKQYSLYLDRGERRYAKALRSADKLIAISKAVKEDIISYIGRPWPIPVIYNGVLSQVRYAELHAQSATRWDHGAPFTFTMVGLIHPGKGQIEAVEALKLVHASLPEVRLIIAGGGRDQKLRERIDALQLGNAVELTGFVNDPYKIFLRGHTQLMCSRNEAMGRVTIEAMGSGIPVIGHRSGGTPELIEHEVNGLLYDQGAEDLAQCMIRLAEDPIATRVMGERAAQLAADRFSIERYTAQVLDVYHQVIGNKVEA